jgi:hypothetical protein
MNCLFDNPSTCNRELWVNGKKTCWISWHLLAQKNTAWQGRLPRDPETRRLWTKPFVPGQYEGDPTAMELPSPINTSSPAREGDYD